MQGPLRRLSFLIDEITGMLRGYRNPLTHADEFVTVVATSDLALLDSPAFVGTPTAPTAAPGTSSTQLATTAFVTTVDTQKAPLASPAFTGTPTAPTAAAGTNTTQLATTAFVTTADNLKAPLASPSLTGTPVAPTAAPDTNTTQLATTAFVTIADNLKAPLASPQLTGVPVAPTAAQGTNTTQLATTAFARAEIAALIASSPATLDTLNELAVALGNDPNFATTMTNALALKAPLASPALTGVPLAPTAAPGVNTTQLATTAFAEAADIVRAAAVATTYAPLASPSLTGTPVAPTAAPGTNTTQIATTAYATAADVILTTAINLKAPLASPALTGTPTAPTAAAATNTTQLATTAFVEGEIAPKAPLASPALTGNPTAPTQPPTTNNTTLATTAFAVVEDAARAVTAAATYAPLASPSFTGIVTTAGQIKFPAAQNASADVNTLDDYEEGTWTPIDTSGAALAFTGVVGVYNKTGNKVTAFFDLTYPTTASGANAQVGGLPFTSANNAMSNAAAIGYKTVAAVSAISGPPNATTFSIFSTTGVPLTNLQMTGGRIVGTVIYVS
jgi:hypothetical protein